MPVDDGAGDAELLGDLLDGVPVRIVSPCADELIWLTPDTLGLQLAEAQDLLVAVQDMVVDQ